MNTFWTSTRKTPARVREDQGQGGPTPTWPLVEDPDPDPVQPLSWIYGRKFVLNIKILQIAHLDS